MSVNAKLRGSKDSLKEGGKKVARSVTTSPLMEHLLRLGYVVRGAVYGVIGLLALQLVAGSGGKLTDTEGAIVAIGGTPLGGILLYVILAGLVIYGLWGLIRALVDPLHKGTDVKGIIERVGYAISGISYLILGLVTFGLITGRAPAASSGAQTAQAQQITGTILSKPWGAWVVVLVSLMVVGAGLAQIYQGLRPHFEQQYRPYALNLYRRKWIIRLGRLGVTARGVVFALIGFFLFLAAYYHDPSRAQSTDGVLAILRNQPYGLWLLGIVALGLIAFGFYSALSGIWLRFTR